MSEWIPKELRAPFSPEAEAEVLPIAGPPCAGCVHWKPKRQYGTYTITREYLQTLYPDGDFSDHNVGDRFDEGFRMCHAESQYRDFSCFEPAREPREVYVRVSKELVPELSALWSLPVQVRIGAQERNVLELEFRQVPPL